jgi:PAS domain S-box-containing protein
MSSKLKFDIKKYIEVFDTIGDAVSIQDKNFKVLYQNEVHIGLIGKHTNEYCYKAYEKKEHICAECPVARTFDNGGLNKAERKALNDKGHIHVEIISSPIKDSKDNIVAAVEIVRDITARKHAEKELERILDLTPDMLCVAGKDGYLKHLNKAWGKVLGYTIEELTDKPFIEFVHPDDRKATIQEFNKILAGGKTFHFENRYKCKNGDYKVLAWNSNAIEDGTIYAAARDITELRNKEREKENLIVALQKSEERYRTLFENATDIIQIVGPDGKLLDVNSSWSKAFGYSLEEARILNVFDLIDPDCQEECVINFNRALTEGTTGTVETTFKGKSGQKIILEGSANCIFIEGKPSYVHCIFRDITDKRRMENELIKMHKLESLGLLAGGIAHDFNNIFTALTGNLSLARMHVESGSKVHKRIKEAEKASFRARGLTQQLLTFSRGGDPIKQLTSITDLIRESSQFVLSGSNIKCEYDLPTNLWLVSVDEGQISQVLNNLIINADQAMPDGGTVTIHAENVHISSKGTHPLKGGDYVAVSVEDQGIGISEKHLTKVFDPYFSTKHEGHGLGLATAFSIIKKHGGLLEVESEIGKGAVFRFYLPASSKKESQHPCDLDEIHKGTGLVLLMDDEEEIREIGKAMIQHLGYQVKTASDGKESLEIYTKAMLDNNPFDVVIMDLIVPGGMGGKEAIEKMLEIDPSVKVIVSSGYANDPILSDYKKYGLSGIVTKPYKIEEVSKVLKNVMKS